MATRVGWVGPNTYALNPAGQEMARIPIAVAASDGSYLATNYTEVSTGTYTSYWTIDRDQLQLAANEYPVRVKFSNYSNDGWVHNTTSQYGGKGIRLTLSSGNTSPTNEIDLVTKEVRADESFGRIVGTYPSADIPMETGKKLCGQKLSIVFHSAGNAAGTWLWGHFKVTIETNVHQITWTNPNLTFSQNEYQLTVTKSGSAVDTWGETVTYRLYVDGVDKGAFSGNTKTLTLTDADLEVAHTYQLVAVSSLTSTGVTKTFTPAPVHKTFGYWTGSKWQECIPYYWTGSAWQEVWPYYWNGTAWVLCSQK